MGDSEWPGWAPRILEWRDSTDTKEKFGCKLLDSLYREWGALNTSKGQFWKLGRVVLNQGTMRNCQGCSDAGTTVGWNGHMLLYFQKAYCYSSFSIWLQKGAPTTLVYTDKCAAFATALSGLTLMTSWKSTLLKINSNSTLWQKHLSPSCHYHG